MNKQITLIVIITAIILGVVIYFLGQDNKLFYKCPKAGEYMISGEYKWIDCEPPGGLKNRYCKPNYRNWIEKNCKEIKFTD